VGHMEGITYVSSKGDGRYNPEYGCARSECAFNPEIQIIRICMRLICIN